MNPADARVYWVFAREEPAAPLRHMGIVRAANEKLAFVYARMNYDERRWLDLQVVPREAFYAPRELEVGA